MNLKLIKLIATIVILILGFIVGFIGVAIGKNRTVFVGENIAGEVVAETWITYVDKWGFTRRLSATETGSYAVWTMTMITESAVKEISVDLTIRVYGVALSQQTWNISGTLYQGYMKVYWEIQYAYYYYNMSDTAEQYGKTAKDLSTYFYNRFYQGEDPDELYESIVTSEWIEIGKKSFDNVLASGTYVVSSLRDTTTVSAKFDLVNNDPAIFDVPDNVWGMRIFIGVFVKVEAVTVAGITVYGYVQKNASQENIEVNGIYDAQVKLFRVDWGFLGVDAQASIGGVTTYTLIEYPANVELVQKLKFGLLNIIVIGLLIVTYLYIVKRKE